MSTRGQHLLRGGLLFANGSGVLGRLFARSFSIVLDQIEERLETGGVDLVLPDGSLRRANTACVSLLGFTLEFAGSVPS